jgi:hypothetical protein
MNNFVKLNLINLTIGILSLPNKTKKKKQKNEDFKKNLLLSFTLFCVHLTNAQTKSISGKVTDTSGFHLPHNYFSQRH